MLFLTIKFQVVTSQDILSIIYFEINIYIFWKRNTIHIHRV